MRRLPLLVHLLKRFKYPILIGLASLLVLLSWLFLGDNNGMRYFTIHQKMSRVNTEMVLLRQENKNLKSEIDKLKNDKNYLAEVARHKYGFLKKNELVFDFNKEKKPRKAGTPKK